MPATTTTSVAILNLFTTEKYFESFEVECWNSAETVLIASQTIGGTWDSSTSKWKQLNPLYFDGLTIGTVYHFRSRVRSQSGGTPSSWSSFAAETAGDSTPPSVTFTGSAKVTAAGIAFKV